MDTKIYSTSVLDAISAKNAATAVYSCSENSKADFSIDEKNSVFNDIMNNYKYLENTIHELLRNTMLSEKIIIRKLVMDHEINTIILIPISIPGKIIVFIYKSNDFSENYKFISNKLTKREQTVSKHLFYGKSIRYIAAELKIAEGTVKKTTSNIYRKLNIQSRSEFMHLLFSYEFIHI
ncbi:MAG: response regulator transcription factor [Oscillospiraceae bacterium]|nr:response regulator transcription factor [Oscillospiraceae bacterium]